MDPGDGFNEGAWQTTAGQGDVDGVTLTLRYSSKSSTRIQNLHIIWADLIAQSDAETARRLSQDAAFHPGCPKLEIQLNAAGTAGFSLTVDQLLNNRLCGFLLKTFLSLPEIPLRRLQIIKRN